MVFVLLLPSARIWSATMPSRWCGSSPMPQNATLWGASHAITVTPPRVQCTPRASCHGGHGLDRRLGAPRRDRPDHLVGGAPAAGDETVDGVAGGWEGREPVGQPEPVAQLGPLPELDAARQRDVGGHVRKLPGRDRAVVG